MAEQQAMTKAEIMDVEATIRRALVNDIRRWEGLVRESYELCRSAYQIAARRGENTDWNHFTKWLDKVIENQHAALHPKSEPDK